MHFKTPLAHALLDDPAFSPDPRSHPLSPLADARSHPALPPKRPPPSPPPPPPPAILAPTTKLNIPPPQRSLLKLVSTSTPPRHVLKPLPTNTPRRARMKAFVRRLTTRHKLDRIDELDETDPFGGSYHHDGPYEAISSNLAPSTLPRMHGNLVPRGTSIHHPTRESDPHSSHYQLATRVPPPYGETGLSLHLEPGQILQQNTIYTSLVHSIAPVPGQFCSQPNTISVTTRPDHPRRQSLPSPRTLSPPDPSSLGLRVSDHRSTSLCAPRERHLGHYMSDLPDSPSPHHGYDAAPYVLRQTEKTVFPPPRYESRFHNSDPPQPPQRTPPPPSNPPSPKIRSTENMVPASPRPDSRHKSVHSLDSSHTTLNGTFTQPSSNIPIKISDPLRIRHLPKRLVMPAPLQPQPQEKLPPLARQDEYSERHSLESSRFEGKSATYSQEPKLLRKKSSAFPTKTPIPNHIPVTQDDAAPVMGNFPTKTANEAEGTKERTRRRRLSKRKNDV